MKTKDLTEITNTCPNCKGTIQFTNYSYDDDTELVDYECIDCHITGNTLSEYWEKGILD